MEFSAVDTLWVLLGAALVFFMQAGFAMVETGFTRAKNAGNIIMKNLMDFAFGSFIFWLVGFGLMYGEGNGFIGGLDFFIQDPSLYDDNVPGWCTVMFQTVFCATAATIVSGAMAERTKFSSYLIYSIMISLVVYPVSGHWIWGGGWLSTLEIAGATGFIDFAGSTAVHLVGGVAALIGAKILGPRIGKYDKKGKSKAIPGHSLTLGALGVFILWFGWFGFNPASTLGMEGLESDASLVFMTTNIAAACATIVAMIVTWIKYGKPDVSMTLNGTLAGLVAITAGCFAVDPWAAAIIGACAGTLVVFGIEFVDKVLKIDDPVGAVGVHGICGAFGTLAVGLFARRTVIDGEVLEVGGLFTGGGVGQLAIQATGVLSVVAWVGITMTIIFLVIKKTVGLRVTEHEEIVGLDIEEHGLASSYADFMPSVHIDTTEAQAPINVKTAVAVNEAVPVKVVSSSASDSDTKMTKIAIVCNQNRFETLKNKLNDIGVTGITVTQVIGCGNQKGNTEYYRGVALEMNLLPKIKVEVIVCKVPVMTVVEVVKQALYTGKIGDGKIFIYDVENVIKVRTGEEGYEALQDSDE